MDLAEDFVRYLVKHALEKNGKDVEFFNSRIDASLVATLENIARNDFERLSYGEAIKILENQTTFLNTRRPLASICQSEHERHLTETVFKKPVIVFDYPKEIKAFYMKANDDGRTVRAMDVLVPRIGELIGGSQREDQYDELRDR